jgi:hypothetical protein
MLVDFLADIAFLGVIPVALFMVYIQWKCYQLMRWQTTFLEEIRDRITSPYP